MAGPGPGAYPDADAFVTPARERLAGTTRRLLDAVLTAAVDDARLDTAADAAEAAIVALTPDPSGAPTLPRRAERRHEDYLPRSPLVGALHPGAPPLTWEFRDERFVGHGTLGAAFEGPPGYVHGGWVALMFDEALGIANVTSGHPGMTARLTVRYRRPTPLRTPLRLEAWTRERDGRRISTTGTLHAGDQLCAEAEGLFVQIGAERALEYFGERPTAPDPVDPLP
ncbi:MAG TPA: PaaI family thioesterase [Acidimicrobiia bacterium]|nr:PaaI family thioesterase [Acidimicrobiia bacterium]